jgi:hypothetical protein
MSREVLNIVSVRYSPDGVTLELASPQPDFVGDLLGLSDKLQQLVTA